jgi:hypothetical protein
MIEPKKYRQLFLDDEALESTEGIEKVLNPPTKCGAVLTGDREKGQTGVQTRSAPLWNDQLEIWEWWYWGYYTVPPYGEYHSTSYRVTQYARSADGLVWERPSLGRYKWQGSEDNNVAFDPEAGFEQPYHILRDEHDTDGARRYKGLHGVLDRRPAVSPNGFDWDMLDVKPVPSSDESHCLYDEITGEFLALVKQPTDWGRSVWLSRSADFERWTDPSLILHSDEVDRANRRERIQKVVEDPAYLSPAIVDETDYIAEIYQMAVLPYEGVYIGFPVLFNPAGAIPPPHMNYTAINQVELAVSRDLQVWERVANREVFIGVDPRESESYGWAQNLPCGRPVVREDGEVWIYYNACRFRGQRELYPDIPEELFDDNSALCLAKVRKDGFVSLDAEEIGTAVTKPFVAEGELTVNVDAKEGKIGAEVLDADTMKPLPGFEIESCRTIEGDHLTAVVHWQEKSKVDIRSPVRVRFVMNQAKLYSFWLN